MDISGIAGEFYVVEASTNFANWAGLETNSIPGSTIWQFVDADSTHDSLPLLRVMFCRELMNLTEPLGQRPGDT